MYFEAIFVCASVCAAHASSVPIAGTVPAAPEVRAAVAELAAVAGPRAL